MSEKYPIQLFHFEEDQPNFEDWGHENDIRYWYASDLMDALGYENYNSFKAVINRAIAACVALNISILDNFIQIERNITGRLHQDYKLSRFACYLIAMNGDSHKPAVAKAQIYFATLAESFRSYLEESGKIDRVLVREEISDRERSLSGIAHVQGVTTYSFFQNAGYRGMYNKNLNDLKEYKGLQDLRRSLLDYMGKEELASNLFRITQTEAKIKKENIRGQSNLEVAAEEVGKKVRKTIKDISGTMPEDLPLEDDIRKVKRELKDTHKRFKKIDKK